MGVLVGVGTGVLVGTVTHLVSLISILVVMVSLDWRLTLLGVARVPATECIGICLAVLRELAGVRGRNLQVLQLYDEFLL